MPFDLVFIECVLKLDTVLRAIGMLSDQGDCRTRCQLRDTLQCDLVRWLNLVVIFRILECQRQ